MIREEVTTLRATKICATAGPTGDLVLLDLTLADGKHAAIVVPRAALKAAAEEMAKGVPA